MNLGPIAISALLAFTSLVASAGQSKACRVDFKDPFDVGYAMSVGKYKSKCLDMSRKRPVEMLYQDSQFMQVGNFYHDKKFWIAKIPKAGVDQAIFQIVRFGTSIPIITAAHTQIRFKMKPGAEILLVSQDGGMQSSKVSDLIFSVEYTAPKGVPYDIIQGEINNLGIVGRVLSTKARMLEELDGSGDVIQQLPLRISSEAADQILIAAVHRSQTLGTLQTYNTLKHNCTTELFDIIDSQLIYSKKIKKFKVNLLNVTDPVAKPSIKALKLRGLIDADSLKYPTMNFEFPLNKNLSEGVDLSVHH